eukprot:CAMPEP_0202688492 /NCGR_PEP_ID=MMETSP1385-20130828/4004_1 /ASSEMBLY_ACC=CAM_ASM_000861 /TAXON_ID=933848 /ORGANISM="Elphidium margaritaceum" /LENGTH=167 /DNA_ID=CAMNT_0049343483 /DNA_START=179 /DNA_END=682 /DNA_ORIENTATION=+
MCQWLVIEGGQQGFCYDNSWNNLDANTTSSSKDEWISSSNDCPANSFRRGGPCGAYLYCTSCLSATDPFSLNNDNSVACEWDSTYSSCVMTNDTVSHVSVTDEKMCPEVIFGKIAKAMALGVAAIIGITCGICVLCACICAAVFIFLIQPRRKRGNIQADYAPMQQV